MSGANTRQQKSANNIGVIVILQMLRATRDFNAKGQLAQGVAVYGGNGMTDIVHMTGKMSGFVLGVL
jgi:hypothetical protein